MLVLSIHTCGGTGSVVLGDAGPSGAALIHAPAAIPARTSAARLIPAIAEMLSARRCAVRDLGAIVVVNGPGSFTGIRVGLSAAKGLAEAAAVPLVAVSSLAVLALASGEPHVLAILDAGRGEYYAGQYREGERVGEWLLSAEGVLSLAERTGATMAGEQGGPAPASAAKIVLLPPQDAAAALQAALPRLRSSDFDDAAALDASYLHRSDAELFSKTR